MPITNDPCVCVFLSFLSAMQDNIEQLLIQSLNRERLTTSNKNSFFIKGCRKSNVEKAEAKGIYKNTRK